MKQQTLGNIHIGLREHSPLSPRYLTNFVTRRLRQVFNLDELWTGGWSPPPDMVCAFPTYRCNLHCDFCFQRNENGRLRIDTHHSEMTPEQWQDIIDRVASLATTIYWIGGEVMIYPRIMDLLARCKQRGLKVVVGTNGYRLAERATALVKMGIDTIDISLDGFKDVHNKNRHSPRAFAQVIAGIQAIVEARGNAGLPIITINHTLTQDNYRDISEFFNFTRDLKVDVLQILGLMYMSPETAHNHQAIMHKEFGINHMHIDVMENGRDAHNIDAIWLQREMDTLRQTAPASPTLRFCSSGLEYNLTAHYNSDDTLPLPQQRCTTLWRRMVIQPNGDVAMCYNQPEAVVGNVLTDDLETIWNGDKFRQARQRIKQGLLPGCIRCTWLNYK